MYRYYLLVDFFSPSEMLHRTFDRYHVVTGAMENYPEIKLSRLFYPGTLAFPIAEEELCKS